jgi:hypothetical protein
MRYKATTTDIFPAFEGQCQSESVLGHPLVANIYRRMFRYKTVHWYECAGATIADGEVSLKDNTRISILGEDIVLYAPKYWETDKEQMIVDEGELKRCFTNYFFMLSADRTPKLKEIMEALPKTKLVLHFPCAGVIYAPLTEAEYDTFKQYPKYKFAWFFADKATVLKRNSDAVKRLPIAPMETFTLAHTVGFGKKSTWHYEGPLKDGMFSLFEDDGGIHNQWSINYNALKRVMSRINGTPAEQWGIVSELYKNLRNK